MDHTEATAEQLVERYVLDELDDEKAERFEEHYFDCEPCANDVRAAVTLMRYGAELPKEAVATNVVPISRGMGFRTWLATAAAAVIGFIVAVPVLRTPAALSQVHEVSITAGQSRDAAEIQTVTLGKDDTVGFVIDVVPGQTEYRVTVRSTEGSRVIGPLVVVAEPYVETVSVNAGRLPAGTYEVTAPPAASKSIRVQDKEGES